MPGRARVANSFAFLRHRRTSRAYGYFFNFFFSLFPLPSSLPERYRCHEDSKFHLLGEESATTTTTTSFTRARDIYHARDILIKCDDTPRSIRRTKRGHLRVRRYNDIIYVCSPRLVRSSLPLSFSAISCSLSFHLSLSFSLLYLLSQRGTVRFAFISFLFFSFTFE